MNKEYVNKEQGTCEQLNVECVNKEQGICEP